MAEVEIVGVYMVPDAPEPCHLVEVIVTDADPFEVGDFTQEMPGEPRENWQVPWDERFLTTSGDAEAVAEPQGTVRLAFFLHYLDPARPLMTPFGDGSMPAPIDTPTRLDWLQYEEP
jgi:hypothetical protein